MEYESIIGLEVHAQLLTRSKMFCGCSAAYQDAPPNTLVCPVCLGMPGVLPVINKAAVEMVIMTGLALHAEIARHTKFDRKNYPYPDLMKGYQISQYDEPICRGGYLEIEVDGQRRRIGMTRVHLEEDVAKLLHRPGDGSEGHSLIDVNRSGVPLMEMVSEPELRSPEEARVFVMELRSILRYLGVSAANMEEGNFRCDANISIRPKGSDRLFPKVEVKNMNSFRSVQRALAYEFERQVRLVEEGQSVVQETRGWVEDRGITVSQRSKEYAHDYRYFPEPDLPPLVIDGAWVEEIRARLPELPEAKRERFMAQYGLSPYDARLLTASRELADWFEASLATRPLQGDALQRRAKATSNWMLGELARLMNLHNREITEVPLQPQHLSEMLDLMEEGTLSTRLAKDTFEEMFNTGRPPREIVQEKGYVQVADAGALAPAVEEAIGNSPQAIQDYLKGKETALKFLVGQVMKITRGKADPSLAAELLRERLERMKQEV